MGNPNGQAYFKRLLGHHVEAYLHRYPDPIAGTLTTVITDSSFGVTGLVIEGSTDPGGIARSHYVNHDAISHLTIIR